jgi:pilus assembly protein CpaE
VASDSQIRLLLVEDVAQVSQHIRNLLGPQEHVTVLDTVTDGRVVLDRIRELRPDVVMVDALLQGKVNGLEVTERIRQAGLDLPILLLTVRQKPVKVGEGMGIVEVLSMPFSGYDLMTALARVSAAYRAASPSSTARAIAVYGPKGGVGRTTIAYNLAVAFGRMEGLRVVLIDGDMQFGDLRSLLRVPDTAPSVLALPTDRISESDLSAVLWRDPSGIDILLAPPRIEMAEMVTARDIGKVVSLLRRIYNVVISDTTAQLSDTTLAFLDDADAVLTLFTPEWPSVRGARLAGHAFTGLGYPPEKMVLVLNRAGLPGMDPRAVVEQLGGRSPDVILPDDQALVMGSGAEGMPFVLAQPTAPVSEALTSLARLLLSREAGAPAGSGVMSPHLQRARG